jgi:hypothetical protein
MSMNAWLMLHRRRDLWEKPGSQNSGGLYPYQSPDGHFHYLKTGPEFGFFQSYGNATEGTEPTVPIERWTGALTQEGCNEAHNYRLKGLPTKIPVSSQSFRDQLDEQHPIRMDVGQGDWGHVVAIVAYDDVQKTFTFVDSANIANRSGYGTLTFGDVDKQRFVIGNITGAEIWEVIPPRPVSAAIIRINHKTGRMNLNLWLSVEGSPHPKRKIWPAWEWAEEDRFELNVRVLVPTEFIWPPSPSNRVVLDVHNSGAIGGAGQAEVGEFAAAYGAHVVACNEVLNRGPIVLKPGEHRCFYVPQ